MESYQVPHSVPPLVTRVGSFGNATIDLHPDRASVLQKAVGQRLELLGHPRASVVVGLLPSVEVQTFPAGFHQHGQSVLLSIGLAPQGLLAGVVDHELLDCVARLGIRTSFGQVVGCLPPVHWNHRMVSRNSDLLL